MAKDGYKGISLPDELNDQLLELAKEYEQKHGLPVNRVGIIRILLSHYSAKDGISQGVKKG